MKTFLLQNEQNDDSLVEPVEVFCSELNKFDDEAIDSNGDNVSISKLEKVLTSIQ